MEYSESPFAGDTDADADSVSSDPFYGLLSLDHTLNGGDKHGSCSCDGSFKCETHRRENQRNYTSKHRTKLHDYKEKCSELEESQNELLGQTREMRKAFRELANVCSRRCSNCGSTMPSRVAGSILTYADSLSDDEGTDVPRQVKDCRSFLNGLRPSDTTDRKGSDMKPCANDHTTMDENCDDCRRKKLIRDRTNECRRKKDENLVQCQSKLNWAINHIAAQNGQITALRFQRKEVTDILIRRCPACGWQLPAPKTLLLHGRPRSPNLKRPRVSAEQIAPTRSLPTRYPAVTATPFIGDHGYTHSSRPQADYQLSTAPTNASFVHQSAPDMPHNPGQAPDDSSESDEETGRRQTLPRATYAEAHHVPHLYTSSYGPDSSQSGAFAAPGQYSGWSAPSYAGGSYAAHGQSSSSWSPSSPQYGSAYYSSHGYSSWGSDSTGGTTGRSGSTPSVDSEARNPQWFRSELVRTQGGGLAVAIRTNGATVDSTDIKSTVADSTTEARGLQVPTKTILIPGTPDFEKLLDDMILARPPKLTFKTEATVKMEEPLDEVDDAVDKDLDDIIHETLSECSSGQNPLCLTTNVVCQQGKPEIETLKQADKNVEVSNWLKCLPPVITSQEAMKAIVCHGPKEYRLELIPKPQPSAKELIVRVEACGICECDRQRYFGNDKMHNLDALPVVPGHEVFGHVTELGDQAAEHFGVEVGDRIFAASAAPLVPWSYDKMELTYCFGRRIGHNIDGGLAEYARIRPGTPVFKLPPKLPAADCVLIELLSSAIACVKAVSLKFFEDVVIAGAGPLGLMLCQIVRLHTPRHLIVVDKCGCSLERAKHHGATSTVNSSLLDPEKTVEDILERKPTVFFDVSGSSDFRALNKILSGEFSSVTFSTSDHVIEHTGKTYSREWYSGNWHKMAIELFERGLCTSDGMVMHAVTIDQWEEAFRAVVTPVSAKAFIKLSD